MFLMYTVRYYWWWWWCFQTLRLVKIIFVPNNQRPLVWVTRTSACVDPKCHGANTCRHDFICYCPFTCTRLSATGMLLHSATTQFRPNQPAVLFPCHEIAHGVDTMSPRELLTCSIFQHSAVPSGSSGPRACACSTLSRYLIRYLSLYTVSHCFELFLYPVGTQHQTWK